MWHFCEITVKLDFIFRLVLWSREDVSFNSICLNVLEGIKQFYLLMWFKKKRLETPFKSDNVKALITRNVSMGHGCPRYCQIRINRALSLTKGHNSNNNRWILSVIKLDLYFMITYLCMKYESITPTYSKDIAWKPFFIRRSRAITLIIIGWFYP